MPDRLAELRRVDAQAGLLEQLACGPGGRRLAVPQAATGGEPPAQPWAGRIATAEQQRPVSAIHQQYAGGPAVENGHAA